MGIKEWCDVARDFLSWSAFSCHTIGMQKMMHQCKQRNQCDCLMFILSYYVSRIHSHILICKGTVSIFPATGWLVHKHIVHISLNEGVVKWLNSDNESDWTVSCHYE